MPSALSNAIRAQENKDNTIAFFKEAIEASPLNPQTHYYLGCALWYQGKPRESLGPFEESVKLAPKDAGFRFSLANTLQTLNKSDEAIVCYWGALEIDRKNVGVDAALHNAIQAQSNRHKTIAFFSDFVKANPKDAKAAVETLEKADEMWKGDHQHRFFLAMAYSQIGDKDKARQTYEKGVQWMDKHDPNSEELRRFRTEAEELLGIVKKK